MEEQAIQNLYKKYIEEVLKIKYKKMIIKKESPRINSLYRLEKKDETQSSTSYPILFNRIIELDNGNFLGEAIPGQLSEDYEYILFDSEGNEIKRFAGMIVGKYHEGVAQIYTSNALKYKPITCGYIDMNGNTISEIKWGRQSGEFKCGRALVESISNENYGQRGFIDEKGELVIPFSSGTFFEFSEDICCKKEGTLSTYYDKNGNELFSCPNGGLRFSNGLVRFCNEKNKWGYKDNTGQTKIKPKFTGAEDFENGIAPVKNGYINLNGESVKVASLNNGVRYIKGFFKNIYYNKLKGTYDKLDSTPYEDLDNYLLCVDNGELTLYCKESGSFTRTGIPYEPDKIAINRKGDILRLNNKTFYLKALECFELPSELNVDDISSCVSNDELMSYENFAIAIRKDNTLYKKLQENSKRLEEQNLLDEVSATKKKQDEKRQEIINQLQNLKIALSELEDTYGNLSKIDANTLLSKVEDHYEINPTFISQLKFLDLSYINFANVKVSGIDFSGTNASINPQEVYKKDMSCGNYQGLNFVAKDFSNVNVKGSKFNDCNMDFANKDGAILDDETEFPQNSMKL